MRTFEIVLNRFGRPDDATVQALLAKLDPRFPAPTCELNWLLCETLVYLQSPTVAAKAIALIEKAPTQEEQMEYARSLRMLKAGWTTPLHTAYFEWFLKAANYRGGASFEKFIEFIRNDAVASLSDSREDGTADVLAKKPVKKSAAREPRRAARRPHELHSLDARRARAAGRRAEGPQLRKRPQDVRRRRLLHLPPLRQRRRHDRPRPHAGRRPLLAARPAR